jgi:thiamine biosynthesis lipoprotein
MTEPPKSTVSRFSHHAMGTVFEIFIAGEEESYAGQAARAAFDEIDRVERLFSRFNPASETGQINGLKTGESMAIGVEMFECLSIAERVRAETAGSFDVNVRMKVKFRSPDMSWISDDAELPSFELRGGISSAGAGERCDRGDRAPSGFELRAVAAGSGTGCCLELDLGGIGKGYALDKALEILEDWSVENALVHAGTSTAIAMGSAPDGEGWPVGVGGGWPGAPREMRLAAKALSGSGTEVKGGHVIDPRTGGPAGGHLAAWSTHPSGAVADAISTAFMVMTTEEVENYCLSHPDVWALVVKSYGDCRMFGARFKE